MSSIISLFVSSFYFFQVERKKREIKMVLLSELEAEVINS
jgi:hypothetical protein